MEIYDKDIRALLYKKFSTYKSFSSDSSTTIIDELGVSNGLSRIDIAVVNGKMHGYEIKSEKDSLTRLESQIGYYNEIFDELTIVVADKHLKKCMNIIPSWWGVYSVQNNKTVSLKRIRRAKKNKTIVPAKIVDLLWKDEMLELLGNIDINKGVKSKPKSFLTPLILENFSLKEIKAFTRNKLKSRNLERAVLISKLNGD